MPDFELDCESGDRVGVGVINSQPGSSHVILATADGLRLVYADADLTIGEALDLADRLRVAAGEASKP